MRLGIVKHCVSSIISNNAQIKDNNFNNVECKMVKRVIDELLKTFCIIIMLLLATTDDYPSIVSLLHILYGSSPVTRTTSQNEFSTAFCTLMIYYLTAIIFSIDLLPFLIFNQQQLTVLLYK